MSGRGRKPRPLVAQLVSPVLIGPLLALWLGFAPTSVGGDFSYAVVRGDSMAPALDNGDVVLLRREERYGLGDVVAYRDPVLGPVLHRVVDREGERFTMQGDNRPQPDYYRPQHAEILGRSVATWPGGLRVILVLTAPQTVTSLALALATLGAGVHVWRSRHRGSPGAKRPLRARRMARAPAMGARR